MISCYYQHDTHNFGRGLHCFEDAILFCDTALNDFQPISFDLPRLDNAKNRLIKLLEQLKRMCCDELDSYGHI